MAKKDLQAKARKYPLELVVGQDSDGDPILLENDFDLVDNKDEIVGVYKLIGVKTVRVKTVLE